MNKNRTIKSPPKGGHGILPPAGGALDGIRLEAGRRLRGPDGALQGRASPCRAPRRSWHC